MSNKSLRSAQQESFSRWNNELLFSWPFLNENSYVVDIGGYHGHWASRIFKSYGSRIAIFEPIAKHVAIAQKTLKSVGCNAIVQPYALSSENSKRKIYIAEESTSMNIIKEDSTEAEIVTLDIGKHPSLFTNEINLMKINVEGEEFPIIDRLNELNLLKTIENLVIQFHIVENDSVSTELYKKAFDQLSQTHELVWEYPWIWEHWRRKKTS